MGYWVHMRCVVRVAKGVTGTESVYSTRSVAKDDIAFGVSDIDMVVIGEWPEEEQIRLMRRLGTMAALSPLYDSSLWHNVHNRTSFRNLWETDYFFQSRFDEGHRQWKLEYGTDIAASLPAVPDERRGGCYYMEVRSWWLHFIASTFGEDPTAQDPIFRNSIAYKSVTEILEIGHLLNGGSPAASRRDALRGSISRSFGSDRDSLERIEDSARKNHLSFRGDVQGESLRLLLPALDQILPSSSIFPLSHQWASLRWTPIRRKSYAPASIAYARGLIHRLAANWPAYRAAHLLPSESCFAMDSLLLLIELNPAAKPPTIHELRSLSSSISPRCGGS